jgi:hypothetical protein
MSKFNSRQRDRIICYVLARDGYNCYYCRKPLSQSSRKAEIGHLDGNRDNNPSDYSNYGLYHPECNYAQYKHRQEFPISDRPMTPEMEKREILRPLFLKEINRRINKNQSCCLGEALYDVSNVIDSSVQFARDNLKQELGEHGVWVIGKERCESPLCKRKHIYLKDEIPFNEE